MSGDRIVGKYGEDQAALFLVSCGMRILAKNVRSGRREVDLVALDGTILVFVEVKTRTTQQYGHPEDHVGRHKQRMIMEAAEEIMLRIGFSGECRFDIVSVLLSKPGSMVRIRYFRDAFF